MPQNTKFNGVILAKTPFSESHLILRCLSNTLGKVTITAPHARKSKRRFGGGIDILDIGEFVVSVKKTPSRALFTLLKFTPLLSVYNIRSSLSKITSAVCVCEIYDLLTPEMSTEHACLFYTLTDTIKSMAESKSAHECYRYLCLGIERLLLKEGYIDRTFLPCKSTLTKFVNMIEDISNRELKSKQDILELVNRLKHKKTDGNSKLRKNPVNGL